MFKKPIFPPEIAPKTNQVAVTADHAVARHNDGNRIFSICRSHSAYAENVAAIAREFSVGFRKAEADVLKLVPDTELEGGPFKVKRNITGFAGI